ncbi:MAG: HD domain-containing protein [Sarcina sp.]
MFYRIKQFYWALKANFIEIDKSFVNEYLSVEEQHIFYSLIKSEQFHCERVAKDLLKYFSGNLDKRNLARLGLLHDLGKQELNFGPIKKSVFVIAKKLDKSFIETTKNDSIRRYYNHPAKSVELLKNIGEYDEFFLEAIKCHHQNDFELKHLNNLYLNALKICDDRN